MTQVSLGLRAAFVLILLLQAWLSPAADNLPRPDHVVIVMEENHGYSSIIGSASAPYINSLALRGVLFTNSFAIEHPSEPNYLDIFSGSNQDVHDDSKPIALFTTPNLGAALIANGLTFTGYSEDLPVAGFQGESSGQYYRKHAPWTNWQDSASNSIPLEDNAPFSAFPTDYSRLPTVSFVVPNQDHDMHDGSIAQGDTWLMQNLDGYLQWAQTHNSLLIVTFDEDDGSDGNHIATIFCGPMVAPGSSAARIDHFNVLRTLEDIYGLSHSGAAAGATPILNVWNLPLSLVSPVSATPNPAAVFQTVTLTAAATGGTGALNYSWDFGDGSPEITGATVTHAYTAIGDYIVTVNVLDASNASISGTMTVTINTTIVGMGPDSDGDGFSDSFEAAVGTDPSNPASTPTGGSITETGVQALSLTKSSIKLNFSKPAGNDSISFSGTVVIPAKFNPNGSIAYFFAGGVIKKLTLNARGRGISGGDSVKVSLKFYRGVVLADSAAKYRVSFNRGTFALTLADAGLTNDDVKDKLATVPFTFIFNNVVYQTTQTMSYTARNGKFGVAKFGWGPSR